MSRVLAVLVLIAMAGSPLAVQQAAGQSPTPDEATITGVETELRWGFPGRISGFVNYSYQTEAQKGALRTAGVIGLQAVLEQADRDRAAGRIEQAIATYREVIKLAPGIAPAYASLGALYHKQGRLQEALATFTSGLERSPDDPALLFNAGGLELELGRPEPNLALAVLRGSCE